MLAFLRLILEFYLALNRIANNFLKMTALCFRMKL